MNRYIILLAAILLPIGVFAQGTTSGTIEGIVWDAQGEPLPSANVVAIHQPTGTRFGTATRIDGRYTIKNVRVGGPYEVRVTFVGYNPQRKEIENISLNETVELNFEMEEGSLSLDQIAVTADADPVFNANRTGASTNISRQEIETTPTISRSLQDFTRLNPQVSSGYSFGGANDRYNNILVDGATLNDVFGLGEAVPGSQAGVSSPISIDAIEEFNVDIAPFDVTNNGFTGGQVNAITKSGTNQYSGSAYYQLRNESFVGNYQFDRDGETQNSSDYPSFDESYLGLSVGGPIIEDELFFFVNGEFRRQSSPITTGIAGSGAANEFALGSDPFNEIASIAQNQYGYNPGDYSSPFTTAQDNNKLLAKLDWNINDDHKFTLRYNWVDAVDEEGIFRGSDEYSFSNRQYNFNSEQQSIVAQLQSNFSDNLFNEARVVYTRIRDSRDVVAEPFPEVEISLPDGQGDFASIYMGIDRFSQANALGQDLIEFTNNLNWIIGDHELTIGTSNQIFTFDNLFVQDAFGTYTFRSIEDFREGDPYSYLHSHLLPGGNERAKFSGIQLGLYAQDQWTVNDDLTLTMGLRADIPILPDDPTYNPLVPEAFSGYSTTRIASGNVLWAPRLGFNWDASGGERTTQVRGGVGIFSGNPPFVWISNQYSNTGADYGRIDLSGGQLPDDFTFQPDPDQQRSDLAGVNTSEVNLLEDGFKYPQSLKFNLAVDQDLPWGMTGTIEGIYSKMINEVVFRNINIEQVGTSRYGRPIYGDIVFSPFFGNTSGFPERVSDDFTNAIVLDNTSKGYQMSLTGQVQKQWENGWRASLAYTYNRAETVNNGTSSRAISNWQYNENVDVNNPGLGTADFERRHRVLGQLSYRFDWADRFATTISLVYDGRAGAPFSWIYSGDANGDGRFDNDLIYVPASADEVVMASGNWSAFDSFISDHPSLDDYRGDHVERGTAREPWSNFLDLRINQEIQTFSGQSVELTASVFNVLNLLNSDWGVQKSINGFNNYQLLAFQGYVDQDFINNNPQYNLGGGDLGKPIMSFDEDNVTDDELYSINDLSSRWQLQLGIRYSF
ncbi:MAG: carboxypeptidase regulatory-like domain-containing protein [Balneolaceae bacterium]|nr:carboxypeptidase regulatory-like domain-containing protein [Balneolaceae bacterium]